MKDLNDDKERRLRKYKRDRRKRLISVVINIVELLIFINIVIEIVVAVCSLVFK